MTSENGAGDRCLTVKGAASFLIVSLLAVTLLAYAVSKQQSNHLENSLKAQTADFQESLLLNSIEDCELKKADRVDNARGWTALEHYYDAISNDAPSVQKDVTTKASHVRVIVAETANQLRTRILECEPFVRRGEHILDKRLHLEALGDL